MYFIIFTSFFIFSFHYFNLFYSLFFYLQGDIRYPWLEGQNKISTIIESQIFPLSDIYLNLLLSAANTKSATQINKQIFAAERSDLISDEQLEHKIARENSHANLGHKKGDENEVDDNDKFKVKSFPDGFIRLFEFGGQKVNLNNFLKSEVLQKIAAYHKETAEKSSERIMWDAATAESEERLNNASYVISGEMRGLKNELLSDQFVIEVFKNI